MRPSLNNGICVVIISTKSRLKHLKYALPALYAQEVMLYAIVLLVVNFEGINENLPKFVRVLKYHKTECEVIGISRDVSLGMLKNLGSSICLKLKSEFIAFLDDDAIPQPNWIKEIRNSLRDRNVDMVRGPCLSIYISKKPLWLSDDLCSCHDSEAINRALKDHGRTWKYVFGCNFAFKSELFRKCGLFGLTGRIGGKPLSGEEVFFHASAIRRSSAKLLFNPKLIVHHIILPHKFRITWILRAMFYSGLVRKFLVMEGLLKNGVKKRMLFYILRILINTFLSFTCLILLKYPKAFKHITYIASDLGFLFLSYSDMIEAIKASRT